MSRVTLAAINAAIAKAGGSEKLVKGKGYWYFTEGDAHKWPEAGVYVSQLSQLPVEQWVREWRYKTDEYKRFR